MMIKRPAFRFIRKQIHGLVLVQIAVPGILKIKLTGTLPENTPTATLHDIQGKQVINFELQNGTGTANLSVVPAGVYFLRITLDGKMEEWKIVKQ